MSIEIVGLERNGALSVARRFGVAVQRGKCKANIVVERGVPFVQGNRLSNAVAGDLRATDFNGDNTEMMEAAAMPWIGHQNLLIKIHRLDQASCLEVLEGLCEQECSRPGART